MRVWARVAAVGLVVAAFGLLLEAMVLNSGFVRSGGWPSSSEDLVGTWTLAYDRSGLADVPRRIVFSEGAAPRLYRVSDGTHATQVLLEGAGYVRYDPREAMPPLLPADRGVVQLLTHVCPPLRAWDRLSFCLDAAASAGQPGAPRVTYERD